MTMQSAFPIVIPASFKDEFYGTKKTKIISSEYEAKCDHGLVVNVLKKILVQKGMNVVNNINIDLLSLDSKGNPDRLFEIKTDTTTTSVYGAIGQLLYHSTRLNKKCRLFAVFPKDLDADSMNVLQKLNIRCAAYEWINKMPSFDNLP